MEANSVEKLIELMEREIEELMEHWIKFEFLAPISEDDLNAAIEDIAENVSRHFRALELKKLEELKERVYEILDMIEAGIEKARLEKVSESLKYVLRAMIWLRISEKIDEVIDIAYLEELGI
ncbi:MAG: hypothetical protein ACK401_08515 [Archaeoglobaceae archaeon]